MADDVTIGEADDETVLGSIILVLGLGDEAFAGVVVGFALSTTLVFGLVAATLQSTQLPTRTADEAEDDGSHLGRRSLRKRHTYSRRCS